MTSFAEQFPWPSYGTDEIEAASRTLASGKVNYWTGCEGRSFEVEYAEYVGVNHAVAISNGTATLEVACQALNLQPGDEFITTPRTFIATTSAFVLHGLRPIFADVDPDSGNISAESIEKVWTPKTRLIVPVHLGGWPCDMPSIISLAKIKGVPVVEDCAQAHGARIAGQSVGSFGTIGSWSFCQDKIITTGGEGGLLTTDDADLWNRMWSFKDHGKSYDAVYHRDHPVGFRWLHEGWGGNYRLAEFQSAIGRVQLQKLDKWVDARRRNAQQLLERISECSALRVPAPTDSIFHAYYRLYAYLDLAALKSDWTRDRLANECTQAGAPCFVGSCGEIYREKAFDNIGRPGQPLANAKLLGDTSLAFLTHPTITEAGIDQVAETFLKILKSATR